MAPPLSACLITMDLSEQRSFRAVNSCRERLDLGFRELRGVREFWRRWWMKESTSGSKPDGGIQPVFNLGNIGSGL